MRIALVDASPDRSIKTYPVALLKLGAWAKSRGDDCSLLSNTLPKKGEFGEIWMTTRFTYDIPFAVGMGKKAKSLVDRVWVGGISASLLPEHFEENGLEVFRGLHPEAEQFFPDYSLLKKPPSYSISHTSRGCVRKCKFCMVRILEPDFKNSAKWWEGLHPNVKKIQFFDNNWLAKPIDDFREDVKIFRRLVAEDKITSIDFNQALDARLLTEEKADLMEGLPIRPMRFAFDNMQTDGYYQKAVQMMKDRGFTRFTSYVLYNYKDTPEDFYYRLREGVLLSEVRDDGNKTVASFPMQYSPIMKWNRNFVGEYWSPKMLTAFNYIRSGISGPAGIISIVGSPRLDMTPLEVFEYWFGKNEKEFVKLLKYPKIKQLSERKRIAKKWEIGGIKNG